MNIKNILPALLLLVSLEGYTQSVGVNTDGSAADNSALLDVKATDKGMLIPRMTEAQRLAIANPATGLMVYQTDNTDGFWVNKGTSGTPDWQLVGGSNASGVVVYAGVSLGSISQTITDIDIRAIVVTFNGANGSSTVNLTLPPASSYPAGAILHIAASAYTTANPSWVLTSAGSFFNALNYNNVSMTGGITPFSTNGFRLVASGNSWYRLIGT